MIWEALLLGLSSGMFCFVHCGPVTVPFFFAEDMDRKKNIRLLALFLGGRLLGSVAVGLLIGSAGAYILGYVDPVLRDRITGIAYILIGLLMFITGLLKINPSLKPCRVFGKIYNAGWAALIFGLLTGLNLCPPFIAAAGRVFGHGGTLYGGLYFLLFFIGTSVYLLPLLGVHLTGKKSDALKITARITMVLMGVYFTLFYGLFKLI